jgi:hypothetical protein
MKRYLSLLLAIALTATTSTTSSVVSATFAGKAMLISTADKSLAEREAERAQADTAMPEDSPTPIPFSTSRPESLVLLDRVQNLNVS